MCDVYHYSTSYHQFLHSFHKHGLQQKPLEMYLKTTVLNDLIRENYPVSV